MMESARVNTEEWFAMCRLQGTKLNTQSMFPAEGEPRYFRYVEGRGR